MVEDEVELLDFELELVAVLELEDEPEDVVGGPLLHWKTVKRLDPPQISLTLPLQPILQPALPSGAGPPFSNLLSQ